MERKISKSDQFMNFVSELERKKKSLLETMEEFNTETSNEINKLTDKMREAAAKRLLAESEQDTKAINEYESQMTELNTQLAVLYEKSKRYEGVTVNHLLRGEFSKLKQLAIECHKEREKALSEIDRQIVEKTAAIEELTMSVKILGSERTPFTHDFEVECVAPIAEYLPGGESLTAYQAGRVDYLRIQQIHDMLFGAGGL